MEICLVGAEFEENLAVRFLWGALAREGHAVRLVVCNRARDIERAASELAASGAPLAGFSLVFTQRAGEFAALAARARELGYRGHIVAGGHFAAFNAERLLEDVPAIDSVVIGEGEGPLCRLAAGLEDLGRVEGLVWREAGRVRRNAPAAKPGDLDALARPVRKRPFDRFLGLPIVNLLASRGCTHACAFCSIAAWHALCGGERHRLRTPASVADEMAELYGQGVRIFNFHDDDFLPPRRDEALARARALQRELQARGLGRIAFAIKARPDSVDEELFAVLRAAGLFRVFLGIEAGTDESLRRLGRGQSRADNVRALEIVNRLDLHACFNLLMFNPDSTLRDVSDNVAFLAAHPANPMNFCRTEVYAGTPLERRLQAAGRLRGDYWGWDYEIADPRVQAAFAVVHAAFRERNWGEPGLHHRAMAVDYECRLLAHFFGVDPELRRRTKAFVAAVNDNTCAHLRDVLRFVGGAVPDARARRAFAAELAGRLRADEARLLVQSERLLADIRTTVQPAGAGRGARVGRVLRGAAAAAGLAAAAALGAGCKKAEKTSPQIYEDSRTRTGPNGEPAPMHEEAPPPGEAGTPDAGNVPEPLLTHMHETAPEGNILGGGEEPVRAGSSDAGAAEDEPSLTHMSETAPEFRELNLENILGGGGGGPTAGIRGPSTDAGAAHVQLGTVDRAGGSGTMDQEVFRRALSRRRGAIEAGYRAALAAHPGLAGHAVFLVRIARDGTVRAEIDSADDEVRSSGLADAVRARLQTLTFADAPPAGGGASFRVPLDFVPGAPDE